MRLFKHFHTCVFKLYTYILQYLFFCSLLNVISESSSTRDIHYASSSLFCSEGLCVPRLECHVTDRPKALDAFDQMKANFTPLRMLCALEYYRPDRPSCA